MRKRQRGRREIEILTDDCYVAGVLLFAVVLLLSRPDMTKEECQQFVKKALAHAMARDGSSGGVIRTVTITENEVVRDFTCGDDLPFSI